MNRQNMREFDVCPLFPLLLRLYISNKRKNSSFFVTDVDKNPKSHVKAIMHQESFKTDYIDLVTSIHAPRQLENLSRKILFSNWGIFLNFA